MRYIYKKHTSGSYDTILNWDKPLSHRSEHTKIMAYTFIGMFLLSLLAVLTS